MNDAFLFRNKQIKVYERSWYGFTHMFVNTSSLWPGFLLGRIEWFSAVKLQSYPFIKIYYVIIVIFSYPNFNIYDIFYIKETKRSSNAKATHFKIRCLAQVGPGLQSALLSRSLSTISHALKILAMNQRSNIIYLRSWLSKYVHKSNDL